MDEISNKISESTSGVTCTSCFPKCIDGIDHFVMLKNLDVLLLDHLAHLEPSPLLAHAATINSYREEFTFLFCEKSKPECRQYYFNNSPVFRITIAEPFCKRITRDLELGDLQKNNICEVYLFLVYQKYAHHC